MSFENAVIALLVPQSVFFTLLLFSIIAYIAYRQFIRIVARRRDKRIKRDNEWIERLMEDYRSAREAALREAMPITDAWWQENVPGILLALRETKSGVSRMALMEASARVRLAAPIVAIEEQLFMQRSALSAGIRSVDVTDYRILLIEELEADMQAYEAAVAILEPLDVNIDELKTIVAAKRPKKARAAREESTDDDENDKTEVA